MKIVCHAMHVVDGKVISPTKGVETQIDEIHITDKGIIYNLRCGHRLDLVFGGSEQTTYAVITTERKQK